MEVTNPELLPRVLIVDDRPDNADILAVFVRRLGCNVRVTYTANTALEAATEFKPHVALLDIAMPDYDGFRLASEFRQSTELGSIRLIAVTGYADKAHQDRAAEIGFDGYIVKPYTISDVNEALGRAIRENDKSQG